MAKTYLDIVKYMVEAKFMIDGSVDKPDIIGAVFGQTEGLLGDDLDLRELQKNGKIGRIEIELLPSGSKTAGKLFLPASLDRIETCILAAAVESVDRVGPYEAQFSVEKVEDTRSEKRRKILSRAKDLVKQLLNTEIPDSKEIAEKVQSEVRASEIIAYGPEHLPAGPDVGKSDELVIVEGRADVLNLLRNDITNVIAVGGATNNIPKTIITLAEQKEVTVFLDGDRGGDLILRTLMNNTEIDFVAKAPDGKEVEDLTRKEIIKAIRTKTPLDQYTGGRKKQQFERHQNFQQNQNNDRNHQNIQTNQPSHQSVQDVQEKATEPLSELNVIGGNNEDSEESIQSIEPQRYKKQNPPQPKPALESMVLTQLLGGLDELSGTLRSRLYDSTGNVVKEIPIRELLTAVQDSNDIYAIVLDGVITQRLVELSIQKGISAVYGVRANPMPKKHTEIRLYTKEQGTISS